MWGRNWGWSFTLAINHADGNGVSWLMANSPGLFWVQPPKQKTSLALLGSKFLRTKKRSLGWWSHETKCVSFFWSSDSHRMQNFWSTKCRRGQKKLIDGERMPQHFGFVLCDANVVWRRCRCDETVTQIDVIVMRMWHRCDANVMSHWRRCDALLTQ